MSSDGTLLVASNLYDGFDVYDLERRQWLRTCTIVIRDNVPLPALITHNEEELILGSPLGKVRICDPLLATEKFILDHGGKR